MDGATWYAVYKSGRRIKENPLLPKRGLLNLDPKKIKEFGLESDNWNAYFTVEGKFFFNGEKIQSAFSDEKIEDFEVVCHHKMVLNDLARDAHKERYLVFGYKTKNEESFLIIAPELPAYCFLRKRNSEGTWKYSKNNRFISPREYNFLLYF